MASTFAGVLVPMRSRSLATTLLLPTRKTGAARATASSVLSLFTAEAWPASERFPGPTGTIVIFSPGSTRAGTCRLRPRSDALCARVLESDGNNGGVGLQAYCLPLELVLVGHGSLPVANGTPVVAKRLLGELILSRLHFRFHLRDRPYWAQGGSPCGVQVMQRDLRRAIEARRHDGDACAGRRVADHPVMIETAVPNRAGEHAVERDRNAAGQADLAAMGVAGEQDVEISVRGLPVDLRRVRQEDRELAVRNPFGGLLDIVHAIVMGVVDAGEVNAGTA